MVFIEAASKIGRSAALSVAVLAAVSLATPPSEAFARDGRHWRGHHGDHGHHWRGHHRHGGGGAVALGLLGGALAGAALASAATPYYYPYPSYYSYPYAYSYSYPAYGYYYPY